MTSQRRTTPILPICSGKLKSTSKRYRIGENCTKKARFNGLCGHHKE